MTGLQLQTSSIPCIILNLIVGNDSIIASMQLGKFMYQGVVSMKQLRKCICFFCAILFLFCTGCESTKQRTEQSSSPAQSQTLAPSSHESPSASHGNPSLSSNDGESGKTLVQLYSMNDNRLEQFINDNRLMISIDTAVSGETLNAEMIAGGGPDIFIFRPEYLPNYRSYMESGAFADLNEFLNQDEDFNQANYQKAVFDSGLYQGKRCYIPIGYAPGYFYTTQENCDRYHVTLPEDGFRVMDISEQMAGFIETEHGQKPIFNDPSGRFLIDYAQQFIDYENKTANFDSEDFRKGLRLAKQIGHGLGNPAFADDLVDDEVFGRIGCYFSYPQPLNSFRMANEELNKLNKTPLIYGIKSPDGEGYVSYASYCFAINANSDKKEQAYEILKDLLGETIQNLDSFTLNFGIPVLNSAKDALLQKAQAPLPEQAQNLWKPITKEFAESYQTILDGIRTCRVFDISWMISIMQQPYQDFLADKITEDQLIQVLQQKTNLALKE